LADLPFDRLAQAPAQHVIVQGPAGIAEIDLTVFLHPKAARDGGLDVIAMSTD